MDFFLPVYFAYGFERGLLWRCHVESDFRRDVDEICALMGYYAASCGNCLPTFRDNLSVPSSRFFLIFEDGTDRFSRNVGKGLPLDAA
jgi:hypothetical protein